MGLIKSYKESPQKWLECLNLTTFLELNIFCLWPILQITNLMFDCHFAPAGKTMATLMIRMKSLDGRVLCEVPVIPNKMFNYNHRR